MPEQRRRGRPLKEGARLANRLDTLVTPDVRRAVERRAALNGVSVATMARVLIVRGLRQTPPIKEA